MCTHTRVHQRDGKEGKKEKIKTKNMAYSIRKVFFLGSAGQKSKIKVLAPWGPNHSGNPAHGASEYSSTRGSSHTGLSNDALSNLSPISTAMLAVLTFPNKAPLPDSGAKSWKISYERRLFLSAFSTSPRLCILTVTLHTTLWCFAKAITEKVTTNYTLNIKYQLL